MVEQITYHLYQWNNELRKFIVMFSFQLPNQGTELDRLHIMEMYGFFGLSYKDVKNPARFTKEVREGRYSTWFPEMFIMEDYLMRMLWLDDNYILPTKELWQNVPIAQFDELLTQVWLWGA